MKQETMYCKVAIIILLFLSCSQVEEILYEPPVVLVCCMNGDYDSLAGNFSYPNTAVLISDTVRLYFYSTNFSESNNIREGDLVRLDLYPSSGNMIGTKNVLFHMARYHQENSSYTVNPSDTAFTDIVVQMQADILERMPGGEIRISNFTVKTGPISGTSGDALVIQDGRIEGRIQ